MNLSALRVQMDLINEELMRVLKKRLDLSQEIAEVKRKKQLPIEDVNREKEQFLVLAMLAEKYQLNPECIYRVFHEIIEISKEVQSKN